MPNVYFFIIIFLLIAIVFLLMIITVFLSKLLIKNKDLDDGIYKLIELIKEQREEKDKKPYYKGGEGDL